MGPTNEPGAVLFMFYGPLSAKVIGKGFGNPFHCYSLKNIIAKRKAVVFGTNLH